MSLYCRKFETLHESVWGLSKWRNTLKEIHQFDHFFPLDMKGCICHFTKWQMYPYISRGTFVLVDIKSLCIHCISFIIDDCYFCWLQYSLKPSNEYWKGVLTSPISYYHLSVLVEFLIEYIEYITLILRLFSIASKAHMALNIKSNLARPASIQIPTQSPGRYTAELPLWGASSYFY